MAGFDYTHGQPGPYALVYLDGGTGDGFPGPWHLSTRRFETLKQALSEAGVVSSSRAARVITADVADARIRDAHVQGESLERMREAALRACNEAKDALNILIAAERR